MKFKLDWSTVIVELFTMFLGLSAALYADSKVEEYNESKREHEYLAEIKANLENDVIEMNGLMEGVNKNFMSIQQLSMAVAKDSISAIDLVNDFGRLLFVKEFRGTFNALEIIKSKGDLAVISNQSVLNGLTELYEFNSQLSESTAAVKQFYQSAIEPYLLSNFDLKDYIWGDTITIDASSIIQDQYFQNIVMLSVQKYGEQKVMFELYHDQQKALLEELK